MRVHFIYNIIKIHCSFTRYNKKTNFRVKPCTSRTPRQVQSSPANVTTGESYFVLISNVSLINSPYKYVQFPIWCWQVDALLIVKQYTTVSCPRLPVIYLWFTPVSWPFPGAHSTLVVGNQTKTIATESTFKSLFHYIYMHRCTVMYLSLVSCCNPLPHLNSEQWTTWYKCLWWY